MPNEAKTLTIFRDLIREKKYYDINNIAVEEQKSDNARIDKLLKNASKRGNNNGFPDFIITSTAHSELIIVVEAKADNNKHISDTLDNYVDYATDGALLYASFLSREFDVLAIGVSGERKDKYRISHYLHLKGEKKAYPIFGDTILSFEEYYEEINKSNYKFNQDYAKLIAYAKSLNETLHAKRIKESQRALLISGILIALKDRAFKVGYKKHSTVKQLVKSLYTSIDGQLSVGEIPQKKIDVLAQAFSFINTNPTLTDEYSGKKFLEDLINEIDNEINGFMVTHKYVDAVSQFYIEFLRYANNDKGLGIVLTPPHITELFTELAKVDKNSIIFDNCSGTGGFLISSMKRMLIDAKGDKEKERNIKEKQLIGIEYQDDIYALLISNMIIHRDGRTNIYWGDCFNEIEDVKEKFKPTVGLLNPPYKTKASDIEEFEFILNNLDALDVGGTCIAVVPISCVVDVRKIAKNLKKRVLEKHTLEAVMSLPEELFNNSKVATVTCAVILTAHKPHPSGKKTWFGYWRDDGFKKNKLQGRADLNHSWGEIKKHWVETYINREVLDNYSVIMEVDESKEWCVEAYLETDYSKMTQDEYKETVRKYILYNLNQLYVEAGGEEYG